jgi:ferritin
MIAKKIQDALNAHIQAEFYSSHLYMAMSAHCDSNAFKGFAKWLRVQSAEEHQHAVKLLDYLLDRGGKPRLMAIEAPPATFGTILQVFEKVLQHERHVTELVHKLHAVAVADKDLATQTFLQWFVSEQVEEEARATEIVDKLTMVGDKSSAALYLDKEYGKRAG